MDWKVKTHFPEVICDQMDIRPENKRTFVDFYRNGELFVTYEMERALVPGDIFTLKDVEFRIRLTGE